jgi:hypothetical protein
MFRIDGMVIRDLVIPTSSDNPRLDARKIVITDFVMSWLLRFSISMNPSFFLGRV